LTSKSIQHSPYSTVIQCSSFLGWSPDFIQENWGLEMSNSFFI
jgi:hypothetical protein